MEARQYLVSPEVRQAVQHSVSQGWILLLPQFVQQNRNEGRDLQTVRQWPIFIERPSSRTRSKSVNILTSEVSPVCADVQESSRGVLTVRTTSPPPKWPRKNQFL